MYNNIILMKEGIHLMTRNILFDSTVRFDNFWLADLAEGYEDNITEDELFRIADEALADDFEELCAEFSNVMTDCPIMIIADLGLWDGRKSGYKMVNSRCIADCFKLADDELTIYTDRYNLLATGSHHDGVNHYLFREIKPNISETAFENFLDKLYNGKATSADITRYTRSVRPLIAKKYGF